MIAKGNTHGDGAKLADYLMQGGPGERAELLGLRGFASGDLRQECARHRHVSGQGDQTPTRRCFMCKSVARTAKEKN